jgi:hypothetical protein
MKTLFVNTTDDDIYIYYGLHDESVYNLKPKIFCYNRAKVLMALVSAIVLVLSILAPSVGNPIICQSLLLVLNNLFSGHRDYTLTKANKV